MTEDNTIDPVSPAGAPVSDGKQPAASLDATSGATDDNQATQPETIKDPEAYWKAQAEKNTRINDKLNSQIASFEARIKGMEEAQQKDLLEAIAALRTDYDAQQKELSEQLKAAQDSAQTEKVGALRIRLTVAANLPEEMASFLKGETEEAISKEVETLAKHIGQKPPLAAIRTTNPAGAVVDASGKPSWMGQTDTFGKGGASIVGE